ncbi:hypothetical protein J3P71_11810 [Rhizobium leguminosarum]|uniref:hypothetical protein n=1 Tax=Rhizobium leguminosarum TaxID=384 RepID=UPI001441C660|nr:hypothetical protein [Rhizobium leguminosarum]MBY5837777.1 hypothetical protein [Rhizobium leguminosarum]NKM76397.1 hypothetical protein [Rhizobium leguminosarum bv. viciae]QSZ10379.1 hypothetical protein J3P71_11810 [Rhizobium leguminosarum]
MPEAWQSIAWLTCLFLGSAVIYILTTRLIFDTKTSTNIESPSSFFTLDDIISKSARRNINLLFTWPIVLLFLAVSTSSDKLVKAARDFFGTYLVTIVPDKSGPSLRALIESLEGPFAPLFVLLVSLILFLPYVRTGLEKFAELVIEVSGYRTAVDAAALAFASDLLGKHKFHDIQRDIAEELRIVLPIKEDLSSASKQNILGYQVLYLKHREAPDASMKDFLNNFSTEIIDDSKMRPYEETGGVDDQEEKQLEQVKVRPTAVIEIARETIAPRYVATAFMLYGILCLLYVAVVPLFSAVITPNWPVEELGPMEWPLPEYWRTLAYSVGQRTVSFVFALAAGYYLFSTRRALKRKEPLWKTYLYTASVQFLLSLFANLAFLIITLARKDNFAFGYAFVLRDIASLTIICEVVAYSLIPCIGLAFSILCARSDYSKLTTVVLMSLVCAISFSLSQLLNETVGQYYMGYYWHQLLLGMYMSFAYFLAAMIVNDTTFLKAELDP